MEVAPPRRYQRQRNVSADIPADAKYVGRPTKWGNPYKIGEPYPDGDPVELQHPATRQDVVDLFEGYMAGLHIAKPPNASELRGKDLVCWCPLDQPCHADVLLEIAND